MLYYFLLLGKSAQVPNPAPAIYGVKTNRNASQFSIQESRLANEQGTTIIIKLAIVN